MNNIIENPTQALYMSKFDKGMELGPSLNTHEGKSFSGISNI